MASFVIHHIAGSNFLNTLENEYGINLTTEEKNKFLLGNLIVDSTKTKWYIPENLSKEEQTNLGRELSEKIQEEKRTTHFRSKNDYNLVVQLPYVDEFMSKYESLVKTDITALGYLFHLYTDVMFFKDLFDQTFVSLDESNQPTKYYDKAKKVGVLKNNKVLSNDEFWISSSPLSIYHDYTKMNKILLDYYNIAFNASELLNTVPNFINPGIEEVDYSKITSIISKTSSFINDSYKVDNTDLVVFDDNIVKQFIEEITNKFLEEYGYLLENKNKLIRKR